MFSRPFPAFSARLNAWATAATCQWLMGPCSVVAAEAGDGQVQPGHGVRVERHVVDRRGTRRVSNVDACCSGDSSYSLHGNSSHGKNHGGRVSTRACSSGRMPGHPAAQPHTTPLQRRCRYLEETGCASVCLNSCKFPTQRFFMEGMGLPLTMTPNYDDFR